MCRSPANCCFSLSDGFCVTARFSPWYSLWSPSAVEFTAEGHLTPETDIFISSFLSHAQYIQYWKSDRRTRHTHIGDVGFCLSTGLRTLVSFRCIKAGSQQVQIKKTIKGKETRRRISFYFSLFRLFWWFRFTIVFHGSALIRTGGPACLPLFYDRPLLALQ